MSFFSSFFRDPHNVLQMSDTIFKPLNYFKKVGGGGGVKEKVQNFGGCSSTIDSIL